jgi:hypothetical protein
LDVTSLIPGSFPVNVWLHALLLFFAFARVAAGAFFFDLLWL